MSTFENFNGETKTRAREGALIGAVVGVLLAFAFAGSLVGVGVPRFKAKPDQGLMNKWYQRWPGRRH